MNLCCKSVFLIFVFSLASGCASDDAAYIASVQAEIDQRIQFLQFNEGSPFRQFDIPFERPQYFEINADYRVNATVERISSKERVTIKASDGSVQQYTTYAWLHFSLQGQKMKLLVLKPTGFAPPGTFFCAFADATSGDGTYGGGRYLDVKIGKSNKLVLDFNLAYNPYCAYASGFICPLPPAENILDIKIFAGEKDFNVSRQPD